MWVNSETDVQSLFRNLRACTKCGELAPSKEEYKIKHPPLPTWESSSGWRFGINLGGIAELKCPKCVNKRNAEIDRAVGLIPQNEPLEQACFNLG